MCSHFLIYALMAKQMTSKAQDIFSYRRSSMGVLISVTFSPKSISCHSRQHNILMQIIQVYDALVFPWLKPPPLRCSFHSYGRYFLGTEAVHPGNTLELQFHGSTYLKKKYFCGSQPRICGTVKTKIFKHSNKTKIPRRVNSQPLHLFKTGLKL